MLWTSQKFIWNWRFREVLYHPSILTSQMPQMLARDASTRKQNLLAEKVERPIKNICIIYGWEAESASLRDGLTQKAE